MTLQDLNESQRPRVLVLLPESSRDDAVAALNGLAGTTKIIDSLQDVSASEWDVLVTDEPLGRKVFPAGRPSQLTRFVPIHLNVIVLQGPNTSFADFLVGEGHTLTLQIFSHHAQGKRAALVPNLPDELTTLVKKQLAPLVNDRESQFGITVTDDKGNVPKSFDGFSPMLIGPDGLIYAAHWQRAVQRPVWLLPEDLPDFVPWFKLIFEEWHKADPETFPGAPDWLESPDWMTPKERAKANEAETERQKFEADREAYEQRQTELHDELESLRSDTLIAERVLLHGQDLALQEQVMLALQEIGFDVEDMDKIWPEKEPREDYRIRDAAAPGWMVIGDATGTTKGVKGAKLMTVERYVTKYVNDNPGTGIPKYWVIANHFLDRDPNARPADMVRGDDLTALETGGDLVIDTVALFILLMAVRGDSSLKEPLRTFMCGQTGQITATNARDWVAANT